MQKILPLVFSTESKNILISRALLLNNYFFFLIKENRIQLIQIINCLIIRNNFSINKITIKLFLFVLNSSRQVKKNPIIAKDLLV